jgi:dTDP-4-amino-4,6-dideoxygalactose transaminase
MDIPLLDLKSQYSSIQEEVEDKVLKILASQRFILGPEGEGLEKELGEYCGTDFAVGVSSGSDALIVSLMALEVGEGDCVITTPFTFFATAGAVVRVGATPVFCDIQEDTYNMDPEQLREVLETQIKSRKQKVKAVIPIHLFGQCADMKQISALAEEFQVSVVEDAAQAVGSECPVNGDLKKACSLGDMGILSFYPSKTLGGCGDGGMVLTNNSQLAERVKVMRNHGAKNQYFYETIGGNFRLDELQAGILRIKLKQLDKWHEGRRQKAALYDSLFTSKEFTGNGHLRIPAAVYRDSGAVNFHTYHQYVVSVDRRDELRNYLLSKGVPTAVYYPLPLHRQECFSNLGYKQGAFPVSEKAADHVLALPIYPELTESQQEYIVGTIGDFYG